LKWKVKYIYINYKRKIKKTKKAKGEEKNTKRIAMTCHSFMWNVVTIFCAVNFTPNFTMVEITTVYLDNSDDMSSLYVPIIYATVFVTFFPRCFSRPVLRQQFRPIATTYVTPIGSLVLNHWEPDLPIVHRA